MRTLVSLVSPILLAATAFADGAPAQRPATQPRATQAPAQPPAAQPARARSPGAQRPMVQLAPIDLTQIPAPCKPLANQALAPSLSTALSARISLASCMADHAVAPLSLCDCGDSIIAIDAAVQPAMKLLDDVIANADPAIQVIAEHAEGKLYTGLAARMRATLPAVAAGAGEDEATLRDMRKQTLEAQLAPWREAAMAAFQHVVDLAKAHPELTTSPATATAVRDSQQRLAADVAAR
jgi:hypothetical protein